MASVSAVTLGLTLSLVVLIVCVPRRWAMVPFIVAAVFIPPDQRVDLGGLDFTMIRILILSGVARLLFRSEVRPLKLLPMDIALIALMVITLVAYSVRLAQVAALINRLGYLFDALGTYFYCRQTIRRPADLVTTLMAAAGCSMLLAVFMSFEWSTGRNLFAYIGGVPEHNLVREGRVRAQGAFSHPIMAGLFAASWVPLYVVMWLQQRRLLAAVGLVGGGAAVVFASSSTPLAGLTFGLAGLCLWPARRFVPALRWSAALALLVIHFARDKPVWHLISRIDLVGGSTGYHRYHLIDKCIEHFSEWWLLGTNSTSHWHHFLADITNEYVLAGVRGGLGAMLALVVLLVLAFAAMGRAATSPAFPKPMRMLAWALGSMLAIHAISWLSVSYFGQMLPVLYVQLALIASVQEWWRKADRRRKRARRRRPRQVPEGAVGVPATP